MKEAVNMGSVLRLLDESSNSDMVRLIGWMARNEVYIPSGPAPTKFEASTVHHGLNGIGYTTSPTCLTEAYAWARWIAEAAS